MELLRPGGELLGHVDLDPDWDPAVEWTRLSGLRACGIWSPGSHAVRAIVPLWHGEQGEPFMRGFGVTLSDGGDRTWDEEFSIRYFAEPARRAAADLIAQGVMTPGESYLYRTLAYEPDASAARDTPTFSARELPPPLVLHDLPQAALDGASPRHGDAQPGDFEVYVPAEVLEEASTLTADAGDRETGGILVGHLGRAPRSAADDAGAGDRGGTPDICVALTAIIPARHTVEHSTRLTFTSDTWTDVRRMVQLRGMGELVLGWWHSHPVFAWCRERGCSTEAQRQCASAQGFFSEDDGALHRTMFPRAFTVALLMSHSARGILPRLFGWRRGLIAPRGYSVVAHPVSPGGTAHASLVTV